MTCKEFQHIVSAPLIKATTAEIAGAFVHRQNCKGCFDWLEEKYNKQKAVMSVKGKILSKVAIALSVAKVHADDEAMEIIRKGKVK